MGQRAYKCVVVVLTISKIFNSETKLRCWLSCIYDSGYVFTLSKFRGTYNSARIPTLFKVRGTYNSAVFTALYYFYNKKVNYSRAVPHAQLY